MNFTLDAPPVITSAGAPSCQPARLSRLALGTSVPVSATLAPLSKLAIRLLVLTGLPSPAQAILSELWRRASCIDARGLRDGRRGGTMLNDSAGDTDRSRDRSRRGTMGSAMVSSAGGRTGLPIEGGSPKEDATDGGGTEGYVSSIARGTSVAGPSVGEPSEPGVVALVALLGPAAGEKMGGDDMEAEADDGGVVNGLIVEREGRWICEGKRGIGTLAECVIGE